MKYLQIIFMDQFIQFLFGNFIFSIAFTLSQKKKVYLTRENNYNLGVVFPVGPTSHESSQNLKTSHIPPENT